MTILIRESFSFLAFQKVFKGFYLKYMEKYICYSFLKTKNNVLYFLYIQDKKYYRTTAMMEI